MKTASTDRGFRDAKSAFDLGGGKTCVYSIEALVGGYSEQDTKKVVDVATEKMWFKAVKELHQRGFLEDGDTRLIRIRKKLTENAHGEKTLKLDVVISEW